MYYIARKFPPTLDIDAHFLLFLNATTRLKMMDEVRCWKINLQTARKEYRSPARQQGKTDTGKTETQDKTDGWLAGEDRTENGERGFKTVRPPRLRLLYFCLNLRTIRISGLIVQVQNLWLFLIFQGPQRTSDNGGTQRMSVSVCYQPTYNIWCCELESIMSEASIASDWNESRYLTMLATCSRTPLLASLQRWLLSVR